MSNWKSFNIAMPDELIPLYDFLQSELNYFLSNCKPELREVNLNQHHGGAITEIARLFSDRISTWEINNKAWHARIVCENIRRELESKKEHQQIFTILENHNFQIDEALREDLVSQRLYPTNALLRNMTQSRQFPEIPDSAVFNLDYTQSVQQFFRMGQNGLCHIKIGKTKWIDYQIVLPHSLNGHLTGVIAKPRFIKRKRDGRYIGICSYEYEPYENNGENILGVDLGKLKVYSAVVISEDENSKEFIHSKKLEVQNQKLKRLQKEREALYKKKRAYEQLGIADEPKSQRVIKNYFDVRSKISKITSSQAKMVAHEVVSLAYEKHCKEIHLENLSWLGSIGGKWTFSEIETAIVNKAKEYSIKVVKVSCKDTSKTHPVTGEVAKPQNRTLKFSNGEELDRDFCAAINIALRQKKQKPKKLKKITNKTTVRNKSKKSKKEIKELIAQLKRAVSIVAVLPNVVKRKVNPLTVCPEKVLSQKISSCVPRYRLLQF